MKIRQLAAIGTASSLLALSACISAPSEAQEPAKPAHSAPKVQIMGHRGTTVGADENTLAAFRYARPYADILEADVRPTKDGKMVIIHDATLDRTTGCAGKVSARSYAAIKRCRTPRGDFLPSLRELLRWADAQPGKTQFHLELKGTWTQKQATRFVNEATDHNDVHADVFVTATSFSLANLDKVGRANDNKPDGNGWGNTVPTAFIEGGDPTQAPFWICDRFGGYYNSLPYLKKNYVDELQQVCNPPTAVNVYGGLDSPADYEKALNTGAQVMVVEDAQEARRWLKSR